MRSKRAITLIELLAYISLVSIVVLTLTGTFSFAVKSYDRINGHGAIYTEANRVMSLIITKANTVNPDYIRYCGDNCIELVVEKEKVIDPELGIIKEVIVNKVTTFKLENNNIYIDSLKLNHTGFGVISSHETFENSQLTFVCYDDNYEYTNTCQKFVLSIHLSIVRLNRKEEIISEKPYIFINRFSF